MACLADLPELVGFFSYSRDDDADAHGALSALRERIQGELRGQLGRTRQTFRIWQDREAIASGKLWKTEIQNAVAQAVFFIPIVTPTVVNSEFCQFELNEFLAREAALGRDDLVFPILYIRVPALEDAAKRERDPVISIIAKRQYVDWREFRHRDAHSTDVKEAVERFCAHIADALIRPWVSPGERKAQEQAEAARIAKGARERKKAEVEAKRRAEEEGRRQELEAARRAEEEAHRKAVEAQARERAEEERRKREAEAEQSRIVAEAARRAEEERRYATGSISVEVGPPGRSEVRLFVPGVGKTEWFKDIDVGPEMVVVPAGGFIMGSPDSEEGRDKNEGPQHQVTFAKPFAVGRFAVTFDEWDAYAAECGGTGLWNLLAAKPASDQGWGRSRRPVINVSWNDAKAYVEWLAKKTDKPYRLLSEAEWEYAARAGTTTPFWWGNSISTDQANYNGNSTYAKGSKGEYRQRTVPVDSFGANPWGLYQVHGNVWEWTEDCWNDSYKGAPSDGSVWMSGDCGRRVVRGASWLDYPRILRSALRGWNAADIRYGNLGFRVGRTLLTP
jgi:formylglycine-generating enzyme required for sulfatase activity